MEVKDFLERLNNRESVEAVEAAAMRFVKSIAEGNSTYAK